MAGQQKSATCVTIQALVASVQCEGQLGWKA